MIAQQPLVEFTLKGKWQASAFLDLNQVFEHQNLISIDRDPTLSVSNKGTKFITSSCL
jgi:hypothetical protein